MASLLIVLNPSDFASPKSYSFLAEMVTFAPRAFNLSAKTLPILPKPITKKLELNMVKLVSFAATIIAPSAVGMAFSIANSSLLFKSIIFLFNTSASVGRTEKNC